LRIDCAATPALPAPDSGSSRPTRIEPDPTAVGCCGGPAGAGGGSWPGKKFESVDCTPAQPTAGAARISPRAARRVAPPGWGDNFNGPTISALSLNQVSRRPNRYPRHRPTSRSCSSGTIWIAIQAYCRPMVNQAKSNMAVQSRTRVNKSFSNAMTRIAAVVKLA
jgi:hypothetical protein